MRSIPAYFNPAQPLYHYMQLPAFGWLAISVYYRMITLHRLDICGGLLGARERSSLRAIEWG